jgi:ribonucleoside-diphosphate reductase subunit M2
MSQINNQHDLNKLSINNKVKTEDKLFNHLPIQNHRLYQLYDTARLTFWLESEIDFTYDVIDWNKKLNKDERHFISHILAFFVQSDQLVNINLSERFLIDIQTIPKSMMSPAKLFYNFQQMIEDVHSLTYETTLNTLVTDPSENEYYKNAIANIPAVNKKAQWAIKYIEDQTSTFGIRLIAFAILEGLMFSGSFCAIFWLQERNISDKNILRGLVQSNKFICRDENLHYEFALTLFDELKHSNEYHLEYNVDTIYQMIRDAVDIETEFINVSIPCNMIGMNANLMTQYIQYTADKLLLDIELEPIFNIENPFPFMNNLGLTDKANFFENKETVYQRPVSGNDNNKCDLTDLDF